MSDINKERMSSLLDNELEYSQTMDVMAALDADDALQKKFDRYALIREAMKEEVVVQQDSFLKNVQDALKTEPTVLAPSRGKQENKKYIAVALAASVAIFSVAIFDMGLFTNTSPVQHSVASADIESAQMLALEELQREEDALNEELTLEPQLVTFEK